MKLFQDELSSPIGKVYLISDGVSLRAVDFEGYELRMHRLLSRHYGRYTLHSAHNPGGLTTRLADYFAGNLSVIDNLPVVTKGTSFQHSVWMALRTIPVGTTASYASIAVKIGSPNACRAVGLANGSNPVGIVVPCHRVVGTDKRLTGYGGGLERKEWLLRHEGVDLQLKSTQHQKTLFNV